MWTLHDVSRDKGLPSLVTSYNTEDELATVGRGALARVRRRMIMILN